MQYLDAKFELLHSGKFHTRKYTVISRSAKIAVSVTIIFNQVSIILVQVFRQYAMWQCDKHCNVIQKLSLMLQGQNHILRVTENFYTLRDILYETITMKNFFSS